MKKRNENIITLFAILLFMVLFFFCFYLFLDYRKKSIQVDSINSDDVNTPNVLININPVDLNEKINQNRNINIREEMTYEEQDIDFTTQYVDNENLPSGTIHVTQIGLTGKQDVITIKRYDDDKLIYSHTVADNIKKASVNKIVEIGVGRGKNRYELKEGDVVYSTPDSLPIMEIADLNGNKLLTIPKGTEVRVLNILNNGWCYVYCSYRNGYVLSECLSNINPIQKIQDGNFDYELSKSELLERLSFDMNINEPSGLSLEQFRKILSNNDQDKFGIFEENADYFYYAEQEYGINGVFLASLGIHESGWGTSRIALDKNNLFGYQAYDSSPYISAKTFENYAEGIDFVARILIKYYLNNYGTRNIWW